MSDSLLAGLNPPQRHAVTLEQGSALVLAGAGSGKTRVLTTRIAWLLQVKQVPAYRILAVTFTNKAAREMQTRIEGLIGQSCRGMWIGTFHGLCHRFLRQHWRDAGLAQNFAIIDMQDQLSAIKRLLKQHNIDSERYPPKQIQFFINQNKEQGLRPQQLPPAHDVYGKQLQQLYLAYQAQCEQEHTVDFAELLLRSYELLAAHAALREHYQQRFAHLLIDEFQDTNALQYRWLTLLSGSDNQIFAVGDDDQSIYGFRGAEIGNMRRLMQDYALEQPIKLEQNYRSTGAILQAANAVIARNQQRLGKQLWTEAAEGAPLKLFQANNEQNEAEHVVEQVRALRQQALPYSEIAVLYRSNAQSRLLEHHLFQAGIPYRVYGGLRFFERQEIKHALAYLRLILDPDDDAAFLRVVNVPARGIGSRSVEQLQQFAQQQQQSLWQSCSQLTGRVASKFLTFTLLIERLQEACQSLDFASQVEAVVKGSGLREFYGQEKEGRERLDNLDELVNAAALFSQTNPEWPLADFLAHAALEAGEHGAKPGEDAVQLMTVHAAKGLEFHSVFLVGLEESLFPHENALSEHSGLEEERRLLYVALTRARQQLFLSHAQARFLHGQMRYPLRSRFVDDIPANILQTIGVARSPIAPHMPHTAVDGWFIGQTVEHPVFGCGSIAQIERGQSVRIHVNFVQHGLKWLDLRFASITPRQINR